MQRLIVVALLATIAFGQNPDCTLIVPATPLTAQGLVTPYLLNGLNNATAGNCHQNNDAQTCFVEAVIWDANNNALSAYHPLVIDQNPLTPGVHPQLVAPTPVTLNPGSTVALWFGANSNTLTLLDNGAGSLQAGSCVNGIIFNGQLSIFGQVAYCNAVTFFALVQAAISSNALVAPPLGTAIDGDPCPTVRDFSLVDMDPSDNVVTSYIVDANSRTAQNNSQNLMALGIANVMVKVNPSDNRLITAIDAAIGCKPWMIPNLDDNVNGVTGVHGMVATQATNELHAFKFQQAPIAYIPLGDPMARVANQPNLQKVNAYRAGLGQPNAATSNDANIVDFCTNFYNIHPRRLLKNFRTLINFPSPAPTVADSLFTFMAQRFFAAFGRNNLNCQDLLGVNNPINLTVNGNGLVIGAVIVPPTTLTGTTNSGTIKTTTPVVTAHAAASGLSVNGLFLLACLIVAYLL
jgi:hypothetical protein